MALISKPVNLSLTWASGGDVLNPGDTKYATGWQVEIPPRQWFNYLDNRQDTAIAHINQLGVSLWDATTEYQYNTLGVKSVVMGSDGIIYRTLTTNTNQDPTTTIGVHWEIAFADAGAFYTKTESDANYLAKAQNLADLPNAATARTNLSVYSQAQTYTKTEVDAKTTVASTAQAQAQVSNTTLITPLRLKEAFQGANQNLLGNGYQIFPGGLILQWGQIDVGTAGTGTTPVTYPFAFPTGTSQVYSHDPNSNITTTAIVTSAHAPTTTGFTLGWNRVVGIENPSVINWFAIGR